MKDFVRAAQALSDETRLRIVNLIMSRECCVCEVMQALAVSQTRASRNLKILYDAGFLEQRNDGLYTLYSMKEPAADDFHLDLLEAARKKLKDIAGAREDLERLQSAQRVGPGCSGQKEVRLCHT